MPLIRRAGLLCGFLFSTLVTGCSDITFGIVNTPARFRPYHRIADVRYGPGPRESLDIYTPNEHSTRAIVIFWYGGSWQTGKKEQYRFVGAALAERGIVTVIPDYRVYPAVKFPQLMDDGAKAVEWVHEHARDYGADPDRIILMGHSAGAHMAAMLALNPQYTHSKSIVGLIGLSGPYALDPNDDILRTIFSAPSTPADWQPVHFASADSPPTLLLHGLNDTVVSPNHARELQSALQAHGVPVETHFYPGRNHADTVGSFSIFLRHRTPALDQVTAFILSSNRPHTKPSAAATTDPVSTANLATESRSPSKAR